MDTATFLERVLPHSGFKVLAELVPIPGREKAGWRYTQYLSFEAMAAALLQLDAKGRTVYHACNAYNDWYVDERTGKKRIRTQDNVTACRSLYDDIDIGKPTCYQTRAEAMGEVKAFIKATGLPAPLVIYSGNGIHLYWPLDRDITPQEWATLAVLKRRVTNHLKLRVDAAVDCDLARVLRPVGSHNRKGEAQEVVAKNDVGPYCPDDIQARLEAFIKANDVPLLRVRGFKPAAKNAFAAALERDWPEVYADDMAERCAQVRWFRDTGAPDEPTWYRLIGLIKHCVDGEAIVHEWSAKYPGYSEAETQMKINQWALPPTSCEALLEVAPDRCKTCQFCPGKSDEDK